MKYQLVLKIVFGLLTTIGLAIFLVKPSAPIAIQEDKPIVKIKENNIIPSGDRLNQPNIRYEEFNEEKKQIEPFKVNMEHNNE